MINYLKNLIEWLKGSADNEKGGASSKKLTGFFMFFLCGLLSIGWGVWAYMHNDWTMLIPILGVLTTTGLIAFGINSSEKKKHLFDNEKKEDGLPE